MRKGLLSVGSVCLVLTAAPLWAAEPPIGEVKVTYRIRVGL